MNRLLHPITGLSLLLFPALVWSQGTSNYPSEDFCATDRANSYEDGYNSCDANWSAYMAHCLIDPGSCGITLDACLPDPEFGETEPNDNMVTADPLILETGFWGQSYSSADQDWFYTVTTVPNQNMTVSFSVPQKLDGTYDLTGWEVSIRDAAGNVFAKFDTGVTGPVDSQEGSINYRVTLGFAGTYYIVVRPADLNQIYGAYSLAVVLQETDLDTPNYIVGFYDVEIEPNNLPSQSNPLATSVTMYGLINLTFNYPVPEGGAAEDATYVWGQGEDDWFVYYTSGREIISLSFCAREACDQGNWQVEVYDETTAQALEAGALRSDVIPLVSFNTDNQGGTVIQDATENQDGNGESETLMFGLSEPGYYYTRVNHKRRYDAPCNAYQFVSSSSESGFTGSCGPCDGNNCYIPTDACADGDLVCQNEISESCVPGIEPGCQEECETTGTNEDGTPIEECIYYLTTALCSCSIYGGVVEIPVAEGAVEGSLYTAPYNFTWQGTKLPPSTVDTDAYDDFLDRNTPYD